MHRTSLAVLTCLSLAAPAAAQDLVWLGSADGNGASLMYGLPETDHIPLAFYCDGASGETTFSYEFAPINAVDGASVVVTLEAGDAIVPVKTVGVSLEELGIFILQGRIALDDRVAALFAADGPLSVFVEDGSEEIPLAGARDAARPLFEMCG